MWYILWSTLSYANTFMCTPAHGGRAGNLGDRSPVRVRLSRTPLPDPPRPCRGAVDPHHGPSPARPRPDGAPCHACLAPARPRRAAAPLVTPARSLDPLRGCGLRGLAGAGAPESTDVRPAPQPMDAGAGRRGAFRSGSDASAGQRRSHACGPPPLGRGLATGHAVDAQPRSGLDPKKTAATG